jgi:hypothetical protein
MDMIKFFGKVLLFVTVPAVFVVVSTCIITSLIAIISSRYDGITFGSAFQTSLGVITFLMTLTSIVGMIMFLVSLEDKKYKG